MSADDWNQIRTRNTAHAAPDIGSEPAEWAARALCLQTDPAVFFPKRGESAQAAKRVCAACDVTAECLQYALENNERFGVYGGLSERERRGLKRARPVARIAHGTTSGARAHRRTGGKPCRGCAAAERDYNRRCAMRRGKPAPSSFHCPTTDCGRTFTTPQGAATHNRRAHEGFDPRAHAHGGAA